MILTKKDLIDNIKDYPDNTPVVICNHNEADYIQDVKLHNVALNLESYNNNPYIMQHYILLDEENENFELLHTYENIQECICISFKKEGNYYE